MAHEQRTPEKDGNVTEKGRRGRSPSYPGLNLEEAIGERPMKVKMRPMLMLCSVIGDTSRRVALDSLFLRHLSNTDLSRMMGAGSQEKQEFQALAWILFWTSEKTKLSVYGHQKGRVASFIVQRCLGQLRSSASIGPDVTIFSGQG